MNKHIMSSLFVTAGLALSGCEDDGATFQALEHKPYLGSDIKACFDGLSKATFQRLDYPLRLVRYNQSGTATCNESFSTNGYFATMTCEAFPKDETPPYTIGLRKYSGSTNQIAGLVVQGKTLFNDTVYLTDVLYSNGSEEIAVRTAQGLLTMEPYAKDRFPERQYFDLMRSPDLHCPELSKADEDRILMLVHTLPANYTPTARFVPVWRASITPN